jgi:hypothetical protein
MGKNSRREYFRAIYKRYRRAGLAEKGQILDEFCRVCRYQPEVCNSEVEWAGPGGDAPPRTPPPKGLDS